MAEDTNGYAPMTRYLDTCREFRWQVPERFNFGRDVVDAHAARHPDHLALLWCNDAGEERRFTFADIARLSDRLAAGLAARGIGRGERVIVMLPRVPEWQIAMVACFKLGAVPIPCIEMLTEKDVAYRARHSGAVAAITTARSTAKFAAVDGLRARVCVGEHAGWESFVALLDTSIAGFSCADMGAEEPAILYYTSGSSGLPKGVTHASRALWCWRVSAWYWHEYRREDVNWCTADTGWSKAGTSILFGPWSCGTTVLFYDGPFDPVARLRLIERHGVTVFCAAATEFRRLIREDLTRHDLSRLRLAVSAGETVNPDIVKRWEQATGIPLIEAYGQTETLMTVSNYRAEPRPPGSMGLPLPGTAMTVLSAERRPAAEGEVGELAMQLPNPQLMLGYWQDPARSAATRVHVHGVEYFLTGDLVRRDGAGYLYYEGRADDIIGSAGYRIGPVEVENALIEHPAVVESAVVASPDAERGEVVKAFVVLREDVAASDALALELQEHVKRVTAPYKYPRRVAFVAELPKNAAGKILRRVLRDAEYAAARDREAP